MSSWSSDASKRQVFCTKSVLFFLQPVKQRAVGTTVTISPSCLLTKWIVSLHLLSVTAGASCSAGEPWQSCRCSLSPKTLLVTVGDSLETLHRSCQACLVLLSLVWFFTLQTVTFPRLFIKVFGVCVCVFQRMVHVIDFNVVAHQQESHQPHACAEEVHMDAALVFCL